MGDNKRSENERKAVHLENKSAWLKVQDKLVFSLNYSKTTPVGNFLPSSSQGPFISQHIPYLFSSLENRDCFN
jgi:hypothetical protein